MKRICRYVALRLSLIACLGLVGWSQVAPIGHVGRVEDWTYRHVSVSGPLSAENIDRARTEPRILFRLSERNLSRAGGSSERFGRDGRDPVFPLRPQKSSVKIDWSIPLGAGIVAPNMFPAKYSFDVNATPSCANDYVVFALNVAGATPGQANLVGVNNLYSGTAPRLCLANPTVNWAYNGSTGGGSILTSPVVSLDGERIAYVESAAGAAIFHVLAWKAGQGTSATAAVTPTLNGACTGTVAAPTSSCLKSVIFSTTATDTLSSPWVDYQTDKAFIGGDDGKIYRISCVFSCALNTNPTVDWTFALPVAGSGGAAPKPNGPVYDYPSGRLFVGDQLGELWVINAGGASPSLNAGPVMIGGGGCTTTNPPGRTGTPAPCAASGGSFGIPDSVIMDSSGVSQRIYAFAGNDGTAGASAVVAQLTMSLTGLVRTHVGLGSVGNTTTNVDIHTGAFDNNYFGPTPANGHLFVCGTISGDTSAAFYWIGFTAYPAMNSTATGTIARGTTAGNPCTPITEIFNPNVNFGGGDHDIVISGVVGATPNGVLRTDDISTGVITGTLSGVNYPGGVSGIIFDNVNAGGQASSVYFSTLTTSTTGTCGGNRCAVKLTQLGLN
jgi:hypothetical protein